MGLFNWFTGTFRIGMLLGSIAFLAISTILFFAGTYWPWGWAVGVVLFFFCFKSDSEKKGYRT